VDAHTFTEEAEKTYSTLSARNLMTSVFWERKLLLMVEIHATGDHNNVRSVL
jgi:hypothetical protein